MSSPATLLAERNSEDELVVGAAIGLGMTAEAAVRGGADFLLALAAGRYRAMGAASTATMLPLADSNRFTDSFSRREILDRVSVPVFFGACAFDPGLDLERLAVSVAEAGFRGLANFPTAIHYDGHFRRALDEAGIGFEREVEMLAAARRAGLATIGYVKSRHEVLRMIEAEVDILCLNFGWNAGGLRGVEQDFTLEEAAHRARRLVSHVKQVRPETLCLVEGGPIVHPGDMFRVCRAAKADGYIGGSTLDRVPLELSVMQATSAFKAFGALREASTLQSRAVERASRLSGVFGRSGAVQRFLERLVRLSETDLPVLLVAEAGLGRAAIARSLHGVARRRGGTVLIDAGAAADQEALLFGSRAEAGRAGRPGALDAPGGSVVVLGAGRLAPETQHTIAGWLARHAGAGGSESGTSRLVLVVEPGDLSDNRAGLRPELAARLAAGRIEVPPLRDRPEDIPEHVRIYLEAVGRAGSAGPLEVSPDGYRALIAHDWPENSRELRRVIEQAALAAPGGTIGSDRIRAAIAAQGPAAPRQRPADDREWILDGLRRNRFRRGETARFLGISRKTLYNKMLRHGLLE